MNDATEESTALVTVETAPLAVLAPEFASDTHVLELDAERLELRGQFERADGQLLSEIRDELTSGDNLGSGKWTHYLEVRGISMWVAQCRIAEAEGHLWSKQTDFLGKSTRSLSDPVPTPLTAEAQQVLAASQAALTEMMRDIDNEADLELRARKAARANQYIAQQVADVTHMRSNELAALPAKEPELVQSAGVVIAVLFRNDTNPYRHIDAEQLFNELQSRGYDPDTRDLEALSSLFGPSWEARATNTTTLSGPTAYATRDTR
jgi:hypothetical protein